MLRFIEFYMFRFDVFLLSPVVDEPVTGNSIQICFKRCDRLVVFNATNYGQPDIVGKIFNQLVLTTTVIQKIKQAVFMPHIQDLKSDRITLLVGQQE